MRILICGGAGYIGSHLVREILRTTSHSVVIVDNLSAAGGVRPPIDDGAVLEIGDVRDAAFIDRVFTTHEPIDAVVHMCAKIVVPHSVRDPLEYYDNNVVGSLRILQAMVKHKCRYFVFSSTAALFGEFGDAPIPPDAPTAPQSPYGETKLVTEWMMRAADFAHGIKFVALRYFNACGAHEEGDIGENHVPETHLIPLVLQVPLGRRASIAVLGTDYPTKDGSCVRDYVHISDLATAHIGALEYLQKGGASDVFNLGNGVGYSVWDVIHAARRVTGHDIPATVAPRREGDPPILVASAEKAKHVLGWQPKYIDLDSIVKSAWNYHKQHPPPLP